MASKKHEEQEAIAAQYARSIYESVEGIAPTQVKYGQNNKLEGISGQKHQIDVAIWGTNDIIIIECKHRETRNITVDMVLTFLSAFMIFASIFCTMRKPIQFTV
jgi:YbbR domain-containing protein